MLMVYYLNTVLPYRGIFLSSIFSTSNALSGVQVIDKKDALDVLVGLLTSDTPHIVQCTFPTPYIGTQTGYFSFFIRCDFLNCMNQGRGSSCSSFVRTVCQNALTDRSLQALYIRITTIPINLSHTRPSGIGQVKNILLKW